MTKNGQVEDEELPPEGTAKVPEGLSSLVNWAQMWMMGLANKDETRLWLRANIVPLTREVDNPDGSKRTKLRPIALLETHLKLIESVAVDQHVNHIIVLMQEQQVRFRVRDGAEAMINAVRKFLKNDTNRILMQGEIANAYGSINRLSVLKAVRKHIPCLAPLCASQFVRDGTVAVKQERGENGKKCELHYSAAKGVWQGSTLSSATFCLTFWSKMSEVMAQANREAPAMGTIAYADDFIVNSDKTRQHNIVKSKRRDNKEQEKEKI